MLALLNVWPGVYGLRSLLPILFFNLYFRQEQNMVLFDLKANLSTTAFLRFSLFLCTNHFILEFA
jgi:hypothetical protein